MICSHPVLQKKRVIENNKQLYIEEERSLDLYEKEVVTPEESLQIKDIHDVSYKTFSDTYGLLYLHTIKGVRTFMVRKSPEVWMKELRVFL